MTFPIESHSSVKPLFAGSTGYAYVPQMTAPKRYLAYMAAFSRMASVRQVYDFLCSTLRLRAEDVRLWHLRDEVSLLPGGQYR